MVDVTKLIKGMTLLTHEFDQYLGRENVLIGSVFLVNQESNEVIVRIKGENRAFPAEKLWRLPYEEECEKEEKLMGFILSISQNQVGSMGIAEVAETIKKRGVKAIRDPELIKVL